MGSTISVSDDTKRELDRLKAEYGYRSMDSLLTDILREDRKRRLAEASDFFRKRLEEKGLTLDDVKREGERIRKDLHTE